MGLPIECMTQSAATIQLTSIPALRDVLNVVLTNAEHAKLSVIGLTTMRPHAIKLLGVSGVVQRVAMKYLSDQSKHRDTLLAVTKPAMILSLTVSISTPSKVISIPATRTTHRTVSLPSQKLATKNTVSNVASKRISVWALRSSPSWATDQVLERLK